MIKFPTRLLLCCAAIAALRATSASAQGASSVRWSAARTVDSTRAGNFALEALGGSIGSLVGIGVVGLSANCGTDDLECIIVHVGAGGVLGALGATVGTTIAARHTGAPRSIVGAALGAIAGTGVGLGIHYTLNRSSDRNLGDAITVPIFVLSQGIFSAAGSRLLGRR